MSLAEEEENVYMALRFRTERLMENGKGSVLWALLKTDGRGDGQEELSLIWTRLRVRDEAMACERRMGHLLVGSSD